MPIRPENKSRYPKHWPLVSWVIRAFRAKWRCEFRLDAQGRPGVGGSRRCEARQGGPHPITGSIVVLTVAHLDHTPENIDPKNLLAGCQRCHLVYDQQHHAESRRANQDAAAGQAQLF